MSHLTDRARSSCANDAAAVSGRMFDEILARRGVHRRTLLGGGVGAVIASLFGAGLTGCGGGGGGHGGDDSGDAYAATFAAVAATRDDAVTLPAGYRADVLFAAGDPVAAGAAAFAGRFLGSAATEKVGGGNHDGMHFFELDGVDPNRGGLLAINHEFPDFQILMAGDYDAATASDEQKRIALSAVGVTVIEVERVDDAWRVKAGSRYNKRYTGNTAFEVSGPAARVVGAFVTGTLNNCSSGATPWGTYLSCEETRVNYLDPTQAATGYGWVVEIDPRDELEGLPVKRTALGRFDHENSAYLLGDDQRVAFYLGDDSTPGCIYKFVCSGKVNATDRAANAELLDHGTLYAARFNADGTGEWLALVQGRNGLVAGAIDPGNETQGPRADATIDFNTQADVLIHTQAAARVAGATLMDRPESITCGPDRTLYCALTNNAGRAVADAPNPRRRNRHGHIIQWNETGNVPTATTFAWEVLLQAGDPSLVNADGNLIGTLDGDTFSSPDGLRADPQNRLWTQTDMSIPGDSGLRKDDGSTMTNEEVFGNNGMYHLDRDTGASKRFLVGPVGCEITGIAYTPDLKTFFVNLQHPTGEWPSNVHGNALPPRSATIVVRREDGKPVGA